MTTLTTLSALSDSELAALTSGDGSPLPLACVPAFRRLLEEHGYADASTAEIPEAAWLAALDGAAVAVALENLPRAQRLSDGSVAYWEQGTQAWWLVSRSDAITYATAYLGQEDAYSRWCAATTARDLARDSPLLALRSEAREAGDDAQAALCDRALAGDLDARVACSDAIDAARANGSPAPKTISYDEYWNLVLGAGKSAGEIVGEFELVASGLDGLDEWLGTAESEAWALGGRGGDLPASWAAHHTHALAELTAAIEAMAAAEVAS